MLSKPGPWLCDLDYWLLDPPTTIQPTTGRTIRPTSAASLVESSNCLTSPSYRRHLLVDRKSPIYLERLITVSRKRKPAGLQSNELSRTLHKYLTAFLGRRNDALNVNHNFRRRCCSIFCMRPVSSSCSSEARKSRRSRSMVTRTTLRECVRRSFYVRRPDGKSITDVYFRTTYCARVNI